VIRRRHMTSQSAISLLIEFPKVARLSGFEFCSYGEPENHKMLYDYGKNTLSQWEIYIADMRKKMRIQICSLLVSQCQKHVIYPS